MLAIGVPYNVEMVKSLFANSSRIIEVRFYTDQSFNHEATKEQWDESARFNCNCFCLITFLSYSAAKKTLDTLKPDQNVQLYWVNVNKIVVGEAASDENIGCTNSFYQGYVWFGAGLIVEDDKDLVPSDKLREIENIWKTDTVEDNVSNTHRLKVENETKLDMIRNKKYRYQLLWYSRTTFKCMRHATIFTMFVDWSTASLLLSQWRLSFELKYHHFVWAWPALPGWSLN